MKARSRQAPVRSAVPRLASPPHVSAPPSTLAASVPWEHWLDRLPAPRQYELLATPTASRLDQAIGSPLPRAVISLLTNDAVDLALAPTRLQLDGEFAAAVARALQTPDLCLWNRPPSKDASIHVAEVVRQAVRLGWRVLAVANSPTPLERMLAKLAGDATFLAVRFCAPGEHASNGPLTRFRLEEQRASLRVRLLARAAQLRAERDIRRARFETELAVWKTLRGAIDEIAALDVRRDELIDRKTQLSTEVRREASALTDDERALATGPFAAEFARIVKVHRERLDACESVLVPLHDQRDSFERVLAELARELGRINPLLASFRGGKWWTLSYWTTRFNSVLLRHAESMSEQERSLRADRERLAAAIASADAQRQSALDARTAEVDSLVDSEVSRRQTEIDQQIELLASNRERALTEWRQATEQLANAAHRPAEPTLENHERAHRRWIEVAHAESSALGQDLSPQDIAADFLKRMPSLAPVVVGTTLALARNAEFAAAAQVPFDLVIVDDADRFAESELLAILGKASRALVIGSSTAASSSFAKLWKRLHRSEPPTTYQWSRGSEGYVCTLRTVAPNEQPFVESERLADFPEIELRILSIPKQPPRLAQVVFPATMSAVEAKTLIYRELQEAAVDRVDRPKRISDSPETFTIAWECPESPTEEILTLEPGLREAICVHGSQLTTCHLAFDKSAGWDQPKIDDWLRRHLPTLDAPRTADLT